MNPAPLMQLITAYWESQVLFTANRIGLFERLDNNALSCKEIAAGLNLHPRPTRLLLNACVALGLLEESQGKFRNSPLSAAFLVPGNPSYMGDMIRYSDDLYASWGQLEQTLRDNRPALSPSAYLGDDPEKTRHFVYAMHHRALGIGRALTELLDLSGCRRLLDVGGGPGTYSAMLTRRYPDLQAQVLDLPEIVAHANAILADMETDHRITTLGGDYRTTAFPPHNDVILISGVFHREIPTTCADLITRARTALTPHGQLIIADVFTQAGGMSPVFPTLFGLNMALTATHGGVHANTEVATWMQDAGFTHIDIRPFPPPMPHTVIIGHKG